MLTSDIRRQNARALAADIGSPAEFGRRTEMSDSQVSQLIGENPTKNIGNMIARRIEKAFDKPEGWMDVEQDLTGLRDSSDREADSHFQSHQNKRESWLLKSAPSIPNDYVDANDLVKLIDLFRKATKDGRTFILDSANVAEKNAVARRGKAAKDKT